MARELTARIQEAIGCEDFQEATRLWTEYTDQIEATIVSHTIIPGQMEEAREFFERSRELLICARAHQRDGLKLVQVAGAYAATSSR